MNKLIKNAVLASLWLPVVLLINSVAISISILSVRVASNIQISEVARLAEKLPFETVYVILGVVALTAALYWVLLNVTFPQKQIDNSINNADDIIQKLEEVQE
jgi:hypothetical protein